MVTKCVFVVSVLLLLPMSASLTDKDCLYENNCSAKDSLISSESDCYLFLAPSSIPGAGMGIFSTKDFEKGSTLLDEDYGPLIPIPDGNAVHDQWIGLFNNYIWGHFSGASDQLWYEAEAVTDFQPGLGIFPNFHTYLQNLGWEHPKNITYASTSQGPGVGAYSEYTGRAFTAALKINAGDELFLDYTEEYLDARSPDMDFVPRRADFEMAAKIIENIFLDHTNVAETKRKKTTGSTLEKQDALDYLLQILRKSLEDSVPRIASLLPKSVGELKKVASLKKSTTNEDERSLFAIALAKSHLHRRTTGWIKENGICLDNIKVGQSDIPHAGRGAKARRAIAKGELVVPMPLLHIKDEKELHTYKVYTDKNGEFFRDRNHRVGSQLLLNYCFGSPTTSLLLCPTTNGIIVNHCSDGCERPNVELRWSKDEITQSWLKFPLKEISNRTTRGLSFDLVASRHIGVGEELYIDYGSSWATAWAKHASNWTDEKRDSSDEFTACHYWEEDNEDDERNHNMQKGLGWEELEDSAIFALFSTDGSKYDMETDGSFWPCSIINRESNGSHTVRIHQSMWHDTTRWEANGAPRILTNYPARSIEHFFKPYKSALHSPSAFRHFIEIPSSLVPTHWHEEDTKVPDVTFETGDRVELKVKEEEDLWLPGTVVEDETMSVLLDDFDVIQTGMSPDEIRHPTRTVHVATSVHPFY